MRTTRTIALVALCFFASTRAWAQSSSGSIAGLVRDTTGALLPGVTVEASSPALIEKTRSVVTDAQGNYKIIELRPGTYTVTFSLLGFSTVKREGIELTSGFTAAANADMKVGALEETVVVTGASPIVDVQNVRTQTVLSHELLDTIPTGKTVGAFATLSLGVTGLSSATVDVGGNKGENFLGYAVHGGHTGDGRTMLEGMDMNYAGTAAHRNTVNQGIVQEVALQTRGMSADTENGGVVINYIPKDGSNMFKVYVEANGTNTSLQGSNITDQDRTFGINQAAKIYHLYELTGGIGGPIVDVFPRGIPHNGALRPASTDSLLRVWATISRQKTQTVDPSNIITGVKGSGEFVQVGRNALPLFNAGLVGTQRQTLYLHTTPLNDVTNFGADVLFPVLVRDADALGIYEALGVPPEVVATLKGPRVDILKTINLNRPIPIADGFTGDVITLDAAIDSMFPNGRRMGGGTEPNRNQVNVNSVLISLIVAGDPAAGLAKGVEVNDKDYLDRFPFLAPAHQGLLQGHGGVNVPTEPNIPILQ